MLSFLPQVLLLFLLTRQSVQDCDPVFEACSEVEAEVEVEVRVQVRAGQQDFLRSHISHLLPPGSTRGL